MPDVLLHFVIRTPHEIVLECDAPSVRVPTATGQVGLRPRSEPSVLAVEPGLILVRQGRQTHYAGSAGGLLHCDGMSASLLTPLAIVGDDLPAVLNDLDQTLAAPSAEQEVRAILTRLEKNILDELQFGGDRSPGGPRP